MTATDFIVGIVTAARPMRLAVRRDVWAHLVIENVKPIPDVPFPDDLGSFCGVPIKPRLRLTDQVCDTDASK